MPDKPAILITCGPSYELIDQARRITNFSTGSLGISLSNYFHEKDHRVICFKGEMASCSTPVSTPDTRSFSTNENLLKQLENLEGREEIGFIFHVAALCDFKVASITDESGEPDARRKISTRQSRLHLVLEPTTKLLPLLPDIFPDARIIGWKYELDGTREDALEKAFLQIHTCNTAGCVVNGSAYGSGFALCLPDRSVNAAADPPELFGLLHHLMTRKAE